VKLVKELVIFLLIYLAMSETVFAVNNYQEDLKFLSQELFKAKAFFEANKSHLETERIKETQTYLELVESSLTEAEKHLKERDYFEAELKIELSKMALGKTYAKASRSLKVEARIISVDAGTLSRKALSKSLLDLIEEIAEAGFNTIFVEVLRDDGYVVYPSEYMELAPDLQGLDPLGELVELCKAKDIDVFPWQKVFFAAADGTLGPVLNQHPEWAALDRFQNGLDAYSLAWFSPAHPKAREFIFNYIYEMWQKYDFAGCQLDYVRNAVNPLEDNDFSYDQASLDLFYSLYGYNPLEAKYPSAAIRTRPEYTPGDFGTEWENWQAFREELITSMVANISKALKTAKPDAMISVGIATALWGGGTLQQAYFRQQNWPVWLDRHLVEILSPLVYQNDPDIVQREVRYVKAVTDGRAMQYPSLGVQAMDNPYQLLEQIETVRDLGEPGMRIFAYPYLKTEHYRLLKEGPFREKAFPPHRDLYKSSYLLLEDLIKLVSPETDNELYTEVERLISRMETVLNSDSKRQLPVVKYLLFKLPKIATNITDNVMASEIKRLTTLLKVYEYKNRILN